MLRGVKLLDMAGLYMDDHTDTSRKFRNYSSRLSEPPTPSPDCYTRLSETPTKEPGEKMERCKLEANRAYDALIQMGGDRLVLSDQHQREA